MVRTLEALPAGTPLLHCYGPQVGEMSWQQRQQALQEQYCFTCSCDACAAGPEPADAALAGLRCRGCHGGTAAAGGSSGLGPPEVGAVLPPQRSVPSGLVSRFEVPAASTEPASIGSSSGSTCGRCGWELELAEWEQEHLPRLQRSAQLAARADELVAAAEGSPDAGSSSGRGWAAEQAVGLLEECLQVCVGGVQQSGGCFA